MDISKVLTFLTAAALLTGLLWGSRYVGLLPWLGGRRKKQTVVDSVSNLPMPSPSTTDAIDTARPIAKDMRPWEPANVEAYRILTERGQHRAARWAFYLPRLLTSIGFVLGVLGLLLLLVQNILWTLLRADFPPSGVTGILFAVLALLILLTLLVPDIIVAGSDIVLNVRGLRAS